MDLKYKLKDVLLKHTTEVDNFNDAIFTDDFDKLIDELVNTFDIRIVSKPKGTVCQKCLGKGSFVIGDVYLECNECKGTGWQTDC